MLRRSLIYLGIGFCALGLSGCSPYRESFGANLKTDRQRYGPMRMFVDKPKSVANPPNSSRSFFVKSIEDGRDVEMRQEGIPDEFYVGDPDKAHVICVIKTLKIHKKIYLPKGQSVQELAQAAIESALIRNGWVCIKDAKDIRPDTKIINLKIEKFGIDVEGHFSSFEAITDMRVVMDESPVSGKSVVLEAKHTQTYEHVINYASLAEPLQDGYDKFAKAARDGLKDPHAS